MAMDSDCTIIDWVWFSMLVNMLIGEQPRRSTYCPCKLLHS